jgi:hypothetical protein
MSLIESGKRLDCEKEKEGVLEVFIGKAISLTDASCESSRRSLIFWRFRVRVISCIHTEMQVGDLSCCMCSEFKAKTWDLEGQEGREP